ncbi:hypothetical protein HPG69_003339 [Diceros bicornis minor]|uniref:Uncharacterized protein n=1 Tax=Diceros bicornis minor TaxID=77932 RepID=A0A7J7E8E6_DICBM|nr:hypothetical protein HPG69_003339 [Diceros bicornis minor]
MWSSWSWGAWASVTGRGSLARLRSQGEPSRSCLGRVGCCAQDFQLPLLSGDCLALNSELHQANFKCCKGGSYLLLVFQICGPIKVRLFSLMAEDDEYEMSVHHVNTSQREKYGCF